MGTDDPVLSRSLHYARNNTAEQYDSKATTVVVHLGVPDGGLVLCRVSQAK